MATHAPRHPQIVAGGPSMPRPTYNVRSSCIGIGASILCLLALLAVLALL